MMADKGLLNDQWRASPWTIKAFATLSVIAILANEMINDFVLLRVIGSMALSALFIYWLLQGSRVAWVAILILEIASVGSLVGIAFDQVTVDNPGRLLAVNGTLRVLELFVLLHPATREWLRSARGPRIQEAVQET